VIVRHQRVCRRHRSDRHTNVHRSEREQRVIDRIPARDRERPLRAESCVKDRLREAAHGGERLLVGDAPPAIVTRLRCPALSEERPVGCVARPAHEHVA
jgi:hypothetical protein